jgi:hypothetical protein
MIIEKPFNLDIDVTPKTPLSEIPESHLGGLRARIQAIAQDDKNINLGLEELSKNPNAEQYLFGEIHRTVSFHDDHVVNVAFHAAISAYNKPLNLALKAESGSGKSYSTTQTVLMMPQEDVFYIASQSPKVISHEHGVRKTADGRNFDDVPEPQKPDPEDEPDRSVFCQIMQNYKEEVKAYQKLKDESYYEVDLSNKVIVFLESINNETFKMLKTTMSHDNEENGYVDHKYVDDKGKVHKTRLVGAPCLIFNSLDKEYVSEFATRCLTATPSTSKDKIAAAMEISNRKSSFPWEYEKESFNRRLIQEYIRRIRDTMQKGKIRVVNPFTEVHKVFSKDQTRSMRDFNKFLELMPSFAMFKIFQRPIVIIAGKRYLVPTIQDALDAKAAFDAILQTTQTGTEQRIISFYWEIIANTPNATAEQLTDVYNKERKHKVSTNTIRGYLKRLVDIEWVDDRESEHENSRGYVDKRFKTYTPLKKSQNASNLNFEVDLLAVLENSFKNWLKTVTEKNLLYPQIIIPKIDGSALQISIEELKNIILGSETPEICRGGNPSFSVTVSKPNSDAIQENNVETVSESEIETLEQNSRNLFYRRLSPYEQQPCDGESKGGPCAHLAEYEMLSSDNPIKPCYCENHFKLTKTSCVENDFHLIERQPEQLKPENKEARQ